jgi:hypothetical protein
VTIELIDLAGRRVAQREVRLGAGRHLVPLEETTTLRNGVYLVRVKQNGAERRTKVAILR